MKEMIMNQNKFMLSQYLSAVCNEHPFTQNMHDMRESALEALPALLNSQHIDLNDTSLDQLMTAYFLCTYCHSKKKHDIKKSINKILRNNMKHHGIEDMEIVSKPKRNPPRALIITNNFTSSHVMYRCFAKSLTAMKKDFECVNLCLHMTDYEAARCFHRVMQVNYSATPYFETLRQLRKLILGIAPDVIVFADIAMHPFGVFLSNLRLAPVQVLLAGHPAPSHSEQIDAFICEDEYEFSTDGYTESVVTFPTDQFSINDPLTGPIVGHKRKNRDTKDIIIPCSIHKVSYPFLKSLRVIQEETGANIHITSNIVKGNEELAEFIKITVPNINYYPALHYDKFIELISRMDMFLMPYPFNGFSTILDCFTQAVPGVLMDGPGIESHQGDVMSNRGGNNNSFVPNHSWKEKQYIASAIAMAKNNAVRLEFSDNLYMIYNTERWRKNSLFSGDSNGIAVTVKNIVDKVRETGR